MSNEFLLSIVSAVIVVIVFVRIAGWMEQTADLRLSLFRPYRGETWPQGVQEEDGVTWQWIRSVPAPASEPPAGPDDRPVLIDGTAGDTGPGADRLAHINVGRPDGQR